MFSARIKLRQRPAASQLRQEESCTKTMPDSSNRAVALMRMTTRLFWCITLYWLFHQQVTAQTLTNQFPPGANGPQSAPQSDGTQAEAGSQDQIPVAQVVPPVDQGVPVKITAREQGKRGDVWTLTGEVEIDYRELHRPSRQDYLQRGDERGRGHRSSCTSKAAATRSSSTPAMER